MKAVILFLLSCAAVLTSAAAQDRLEPRAAEPVVRVKAKLTAFDGEVMRLEALATGTMKAGDKFSVSVLPQTRYVGSDKTSLEAVKPGDYAGAAVTESRNGRLRAQEIFVYAPDLRGSGEGRFPEGDRVIVNGSVSAVQPPVPDSRLTGSLTLHYRGALLSGLGRGRTLCEGRALPPAYASALACEGDAVIDVPASAGVSALTVGDKSLLVPGSTVTVAMTKGPDNKNVTPGIVVEKPPTVEKPQSAP